MTVITLKFDFSHFKDLKEDYMKDILTVCNKKEHTKEDLLYLQQEYNKIQLLDVVFNECVVNMHEREVEEFIDEVDGITTSILNVLDGYGMKP